MKTARFSKVVEKCGKPETYLPLMEPTKDRAFQSAMKAQRVLTVFQEPVGTKTDRGEVGYQSGRSRQFLVFPRSLRAFAGRTVVGIKYELLDPHEVPEKERAAPPRPSKKPMPKPAAKVHAKKTERSALEKVVAFKPAPEDYDEEVAELKEQVRHAMAVLADGKAVAAFNLLKRIVED